MATYSAYTVYEVPGTATEDHDVEASGAASVQLHCAYNSRHLVVQDILGNRRMWPSGVGPARPRATTCSVKPLESCGTTVGQSITYDTAVIDVGYSSGAEADLMSESLEPAGVDIVLDHKNFRWGAPDGDALIEGEAPSKKMMMGKLVRTLYNVAPPLPLTLLTLIDTCNKYTYYSSTLGLTFAPETLAYTLPVMTRTITTNGYQGWDLTLTFLLNSNGWNTYWRSDTGLYDQLYIAGDADPSADPYLSVPPSDMSDFLF